MADPITLSFDGDIPLFIDVESGDRNQVIVRIHNKHDERELVLTMKLSGAAADWLQDQIGAKRLFPVDVQTSSKRNNWKSHPTLPIR